MKENLMWKKANDESMPVTNNHSEDSTTLIAGGTEIIGDINFQGGFHVEGRIKGNISSENGKLQLIAGSVIDGNVKANQVIINGKVNGDVYATERLLLSAKAEIQGNVYYELMEMVAGASINGKMERIPKSGELLPKAVENKSKKSK